MPTTVDSHAAARGALSSRRRVGMLSLLRRPRSLWRFLTDRGAPVLPRVIALLTLLYVVFPFDAVPDVLPFVGWLDDVGAIGAALAFVAAQAARYENAATLPPPADPA